VAYVGNRGEHLYTNTQYNPGVDGTRLIPAQGSITVRTNAGDSIYHGLQFKVDRRFSKGLLLRAAYTYSKLIDDTSEVFTTSGLDSRSQDLFHQSSDRGLSAYDRRQRFVLAYIYETPTFSGDGVGRHLLRGVASHWQWSGVYTVQTGIPDTIVSGQDQNNDLDAANDRPSIVDPSLPVLDVARYASVSGLGNVGRNTYVSPNVWYWDMSVSRSFPFHFGKFENQALMFRAEFYNTFNHGVQGVPDLNIRDGGFGDVAATVTGQRQIKIYLKYSF
jgi:hypothetical protein